MEYPSPRDDSGFLSPINNDLTATPRYAFPDNKGYTHKRGVEVEQKDEGIQVNDYSEDKGSIEYLVKWISNTLPGNDQQMLWDGFCTFDYYFAGTLDRFELTAFLKHIDPAARARDISRWVQELDTADDETDSGNSEISFVELLDWWERSTRSQKDKLPAPSSTAAEVTRKVKDAQSSLHSRAKLEYLNMSNFYRKPYMTRINEMSPGDLSRSVETLMSTSLQVCSWVQEHHHKEAEFHERSLFLAARAAGKHAGLPESDYDKYCFLFRQYLSLQGPRNGPVEESIMSDTPPDSARTNMTDGLNASFRSVPGADCDRSLDELKSDLKDCMKELNTARDNYHQSLLDEEGGGVDEIRVLQETISQLEIREKSLQKSIISQKNCPSGPAAVLHKSTNLLHTICVEKDLTPLSELVGVSSNFCEASIMKSSGIYRQRMDSHSFLCYVAVRFGKM